MGIFQLLFGSRAPTEPEDAPRRASLDAPGVIYAVGDVHGCLRQLLALERQIVADAAQFAGPRTIVMLGDYIDRGPQSAQVLDHLVAQPPPGFRRICLAGNHELEMLSVLHGGRSRSWLEFGGSETLRSYGIGDDRLRGAAALRRLIEAHVPNEHVAFLESLPALLETPGFVFVHAGLQPGVPIAAQTLEDLVWYRDDFAETYETLGLTVVHGHSIRDEVLLSPNRIGVDTGAFVTGRLSAVRLAPGLPPQVFEAR
ncbi:MAG: serine/threonine protein phosphatase [Devosia sp.]|uniref:metallophosphoesterase family protein n=1 Tax=Devosia sp. TaxID=1871048 RepID=UPI00261D7B83|nr:metallophosphoesterase family protein [Devosia sp.]MDB5541400.1 serine/threonine protein phosphatase [Devosia sp.]